MITDTYASDPPMEGSTIEFGETITSSIDFPAELDTYTLTASKGDIILIKMTHPGLDLVPLISLYTPNGSKLVSESTSIYTAEFYHVLEESGNYYIRVGDSIGTRTGNYSIFLQRVNKPENAVLIDFGETLVTSIDYPAEMDTFTFKADTADTIFIRMSCPDLDLVPLISLYTSNGSKINDEIISIYTNELEYIISEKGSYTLLSGDRIGKNTGNYCIFFQKINNPSNTIPVFFNETIESFINLPAEMDSYVFSANEDDRIIIRMTHPGLDLNPLISLYTPNGSKLVSEKTSIYTAELEHTITTSGSYIALAGDNIGKGVGNYSIIFIRFETEEILIEKEEELPINNIIVLTGTVAGASVLIAFLLTEWGKYKYFSFLTLLGPLYLRTVKEDVFDNQKRLLMYNHIAENQPIVYTEIKKTCNLTDGEINWHAHIMTQLDLIKIKRKGFHVFFYLAKSPKLSPEEFIRLTDLQKSLLDLIVKKPGITQAELVEKLNLKQQNISYNLLKLEEKGKIRVEKKGKIKYYYPSEGNK